MQIKLPKWLWVVLIFALYMVAKAPHTLLAVLGVLGHITAVVAHGAVRFLAALTKKGS
jgi:hypothetical protein